MHIFNEGYKYNKNLFKKGHDAFISTDNNKEYFDLTSGGGTLLLGHNSSIFKKSLKKFLNSGFSNFALPNIHAHNFSNNLKKTFPNFSGFIFCNSGAEANLKALRIARAITKKNLVANVSGSWHGSVDQFLFHPNHKGLTESISSGLDKNLQKGIVYIPYNNIKKTIDILNKKKSELSCVFFEPIQGCLPTDENLEYLKFLSSFCKKNKILLILDEIITGLRLKCSSVQKEFKLTSDISTYGKVLGGGLPIGVIAISKNVEKKINKLKKNIFFGGTFSANSLSMYVSNETLKFIRRNKFKIFKKLDDNSNFFYKLLKNKIYEKKLKVKIIRFQSIFRIIFSEKIPKDRAQRDFVEKKKNKNKSKFINFLFKKKIIYPKNGIIFISSSMKKKNIKNICNEIILGLEKYI